MLAKGLVGRDGSPAGQAPTGGLVGLAVFVGASLAREVLVGRDGSPAGQAPTGLGPPGFRRSGLQAAILGRRVLIAAWRPLLRNDETTKRRNDETTKRRNDETTKRRNDEKGGLGAAFFVTGRFFIRTRRRRCLFGWWPGRCCWPGWGPAGRRVR